MSCGPQRAARRGSPKFSAMLVSRSAANLARGSHGGWPASADTLLRLVVAGTRVTRPPAVTPRVLGIDEWAWRRGHRYGTVLVDLERNRVLDLLPDRRAESLAAWLKRNPGVEIVARDRAGVYADGIRQGAPDAVQIADRWHLLRNLSDAVQAVAGEHDAAVRRIATEMAAEQAALRNVAAHIALGAAPEHVFATVRGKSADC